MEEIKLLLKYGILAPSSHNSQPWSFKIGNKYLEIYADLNRRLKESDKDGRMLFMALGCLITNFKIAADYFSFDYTVEYPPIDLTSPRFILTAKINFHGKETGKSQNTDICNYFEAISERRSNRNKYKDEPIPADGLADLENINKDGDLRTDFVSNKELKSQIAEISSQAMGQVMSDCYFRRELAYWLRTNLSLKKDGMPGNGHCMSLPISFIAPFILRYVDVSKVEAKKEKMRIINFPTVGIISSIESNPGNWLKVGELLEKILLAAQSKGIDSVIRVASIEFAESREKLKNILNLKNFIPQMLFGLGYAQKEAPHSPRREIKEVII